MTRSGTRSPKWKSKRVTAQFFSLEGTPVEAICLEIGPAVKARFRLWVRGVPLVVPRETI